MAKERKEPTGAAREARALQTVVRILDGLDDAGRRRVLDYIVDLHERGDLTGG